MAKVTISDLGHSNIQAEEFILSGSERDGVIKKVDTNTLLTTIKDNPNSLLTKRQDNTTEGKYEVDSKFLFSSHNTVDLKFAAYSVDINANIHLKVKEGDKVAEGALASLEIINNLTPEATSSTREGHLILDLDKVGSSASSVGNSITAGKGIDITKDAATKKVVVSRQDYTAQELKELVVGTEGQDVNTTYTVVEGKLKSQTTVDCTKFKDHFTSSDGSIIIGETNRAFGECKIDLKTGVEGGVQVKKAGSADYEKVTKIEVSNQFAEVAGGVLKLPVISVENSAGSNLGQVQNFKAGRGITLTNQGGMVTIDSAAGLEAKADHSESVDQHEYQEIKKIDSLNPASSVTDGVLTIGGIKCLDSSGHAVDPDTSGYISELKAGTGISLRSTGNHGRIEINSTGNTIQAKAGTNTSINNVTRVWADNAVFQDSDKTIRIKGVKGTVGGNTVNNVKEVKVVGNVSGSGVSNGILTLNIPSGGGGGGLETPFVSVTTKAELESKYPAASHAGTIAVVKEDTYHDFTEIKIESMYISDGVSWARFSNRTLANSTIHRPNAWSGDLLLDLQLAHPKYIKAFAADTSGGKYRNLFETWSGYLFIKGNDSSAAFSNPDSTEPEGYILHTMLHEKGVAPSGSGSEDPYTGSSWVQNLISLSSGRSWSRYKKRDSSVREPWREVNVPVKPNGIEKGRYTVLTTTNDFTLDMTGNSHVIHYQLVQDPLGNAQVDNQGGVKLDVTAQYNVAVGLQLVGQNDWTGHSGTFHIELQERVSSAGSYHTIATAEGEVSAGGTGEFHGKYPLITADFKSVQIQAGRSYHIKLSTSGLSGNMGSATLDPYKNYLVFDPANNHGTGRTIAHTLRNTLGGLSFHVGYEVRVEKQTSDVTANPRVYGERYSRDSHVLPIKTTKEIGYE